MQKTLAAVLGCLLFVAGCDAWLTKPSLYSVVETIATSRTGTPIPNADLTLYTGQRPMAYAKTGADGRYKFERVPQGNYGIVITRPVPYRDFVALGDSTYTYKDGIAITGGLPDTIRFVLSECDGTVDAGVEDQTGVPVAGASVTLYTSTFDIATLVTTSSGDARFAIAPCVYSLGVRVVPPAGYTVTEGRGTSAFDGFSVTNGGQQSFTFHLQKAQ